MKVHFTERCWKAAINTVEEGEVKQLDILTVNCTHADRVYTRAIKEYRAAHPDIPASTPVFVGAVERVETTYVMDSEEFKKYATVEEEDKADED